jgi:predicted RNA-binding protein with PIN domain
MSIIQTQPINLLEGLAIVLSVVSLIITTVGFFASLKFYRDGVELQNAANRALTKLEEKTEFIQNQVGGMFDKTLDAAIGKKEILSNQFEELTDQLEKTKIKLIEESIGQIGAAGEQERKRLTGIVDKQIALIREKVETTRESAEEMVQSDSPYVGAVTATVLAALAMSPDGLTARELANRIHGSKRILPSNFLRRLRELTEKRQVHLKDNKYFLAEKDEQR